MKEGEINEEPVGTFGLVMPFVTVASKGGPYDDEAYAAGWEAGHLDLLLAWAHWLDTTGIDTGLFRTANVAQADLIAMRHGFALYDRVDHEDGWTGFSVVRLAD